MSLLLEITQNQMSLYTALIGVGGTLLGTILGYVLSNLNRLGIRKVAINNIEFKYYFGEDKYGVCIYEDVYEKNGKIADSCTIDADLYITNPSEQSFNINNLYLIVKSRNNIYRAKITDKNNTQKNGGIYSYEHIASITISGKSGEHFRLHSSFEQAISNKEKLKYYIEYIDVKCKVKKKKINIGKIK